MLRMSNVSPSGHLVLSWGLTSTYQLETDNHRPPCKTLPNGTIALDQLVQEKQELLYAYSLTNDHDLSPHTSHSVKLQLYTNIYTYYIQPMLIMPNYVQMVQDKDLLHHRDQT